MPPNVVRHLHHPQAARRVARSAPNRRRSWSREIEKPRRTTMPGNNYEFTQPIQMRFNELIAGVRSDVGGQDLRRRLDAAAATADEIAEVSARRRRRADVEGRADHRPAGADRRSSIARALARYGLNVADVQDVVEIAIGGKEAGMVFEGDRRFPSSCACPSSCAQTSMRCAACRSRCRAHERRSDAAARRRIAARRRASCRSATSPRSKSRAPTRSAARTASGASSSGQRARPRHRLVRRRGAEARSPSEVKLPPGYWLGMGRTVRESSSPRASG